MLDIWTSIYEQHLLKKKKNTVITRISVESGHLSRYSDEATLSRSGFGMLGCAGDCSILRNVHPASSESGNWLFPEEKAAAGVKLTAHVYAVPSLRISGAVPLLPLCIPSWRGHGQLCLLLYRVWCVDVGPSAAWTAHTIRVPPATAEPLTVDQQLIPKITKIGQ